MDLMCIESPHFGKVLRAPSDSTILGDRTVMAGMLDLQSRYTVTCDYCRQIQTEVLPPMRKVLAQWMSEVSTPKLYFVFCLYDFEVLKVVGGFGNFFFSNLIVRHRYPILRLRSNGQPMETLKRAGFVWAD